MLWQVLNKPSADYIFTLCMVLTQYKNIKKFPTRVRDRSSSATQRGTDPAITFGVI